LSTIFPDTTEGLARQRADVLVSHEAPAGHPYGFAAIDRLAVAMGVRLVVHGHHHVEYQYDTEPMRVFPVLPVGFRGIKDEQGRVILEPER
jgi:hypothetical protein